MTTGRKTSAGAVSPVTISSALGKHHLSWSNHGYTMARSCMSVPNLSRASGTASPAAAAVRHARSGS